MITTGSPVSRSVVPRVPPELSYSSTWSRTQAAVLGSYSPSIGIPLVNTMNPADQRAHAAIRAELSRLARYDDQSLVHDSWIRQRYDCGCYPSLMPARKATVDTAWHEAGHAVAALAVGARFSSASIHHSPGSEGRVHGIRGGGELAFVVDAAGQIAQRLRDWTMLDRDDDLRAWLPAWKSDGGDARHFRQSIAARYGGDDHRVGLDLAGPPDDLGERVAIALDDHDVDPEPGGLFLRVAPQFRRHRVVGLLHRGDRARFDPGPRAEWPHIQDDQPGLLPPGHARRVGRRAQRGVRAVHTHQEHVGPVPVLIPHPPTVS